MVFPAKIKILTLPKVGGKVELECSYTTVRSENGVTTLENSLPAS